MKQGNIYLLRVSVSSSQKLVLKLAFYPETLHVKK